MSVALMLNALITGHGRVVEHGVHSRERERLCQFRATHIQ